MWLTGAIRCLVVSRRSWATLTGWVYKPMGGVSNSEHSAVKSLPPDTCTENGYRVTSHYIIMNSPVWSEMHSCKELMLHCTACWGYTIHTLAYRRARGNPYSCMYIDMQPSCTVSKTVAIYNSMTESANPWIEIQGNVAVSLLQPLMLMLE